MTTNQKDGEVTMSAEDFQKFQKSAAEAEGHRVALSWMRKRPWTFHPCEANSALLSNYIKENNLPWTEDSLDIAYEAVKKQMVPAKFEPPADAEPTVSVDPLADYPLPSNWPADVPFENRTHIKAMSADFYRAHYHDQSPRGTGENGQRFRARVTAIQTLRPGEGR